MAEYIDRAAAIDCLMKILDKPHHAEFLYTDEICDTLNFIPAADVRPVVKAKWVYTDMSRLVCSNCGNPVAFALKDDGWHHGDFCPNCGAKMEVQDADS